MMAIPEKGTGREVRKGTLTERMCKLSVGDHMVVPRRSEASLYRAAIRHGIKISIRRMGEKDTTRIYRVE
jgi:hypothetical protein